MTRRYDIDDEDVENLFSREEARAAREDRAERLRVAAERAEQESRADAIRKDNARRSQRETNRLAVEREYQLAGVAAPMAGEDGNPAVSLSLLLALGWTVEDCGFGERKLVRPPLATAKGKR